MIALKRNIDNFLLNHKIMFFTKSKDAFLNKRWEKNSLLYIKISYIRSWHRKQPLINQAYTSLQQENFVLYSINRCLKNERSTEFFSKNLFCFHVMVNKNEVNLACSVLDLLHFSCVREITLLQIFFGIHPYLFFK